MRNTIDRKLQGERRTIRRGIKEGGGAAKERCEQNEEGAFKERAAEMTAAEKEKEKTHTHLLDGSLRRFHVSFFYFLFAVLTPPCSATFRHSELTIKKKKKGKIKDKKRKKRKVCKRSQTTGVVLKKKTEKKKTDEGRRRLPLTLCVRTGRGDGSSGIPAHTATRATSREKKKIKKDQRKRPRKRPEKK